ncbi:N-acyl-D-glucosamine 2-epimerase [Puteibacter caeruleilacunae]|nr:N-acyl-D-glucosamine 2-epimerase [Puteibacter caeruleilacunae]
MNISSELIAYRDTFRKELHENILQYWIDHSIDQQGDGFYGAADLQGNPVLTANKTCVLIARILWTFSAAAKMEENSDYQHVAKRAYDVLINHFKDKQYGGYFMEIAPDNTVASDIKHTYAQAFVIYALCKYYELAPSESLMEEIQQFFELLEKHTKDVNNPGYHEAFTRDWRPYEENRMADNNEPKSMNTHLHIMEAYAALYKVWNAPKVKDRLTALLTLFINKIIRSSGHLGIFFNNQFEETDSSKGICSFGHDIEASWLLWEAAEILDDKSIISQMKPLVIKMAQAVDRVGVDKNGGLFLESTRFGSHVRTNKHWWLQAENLVGFMNAYELTNDIKNWDTVKSTWNFIDQFVIDHEYGEWYTKVNRLGVPFLTEPADDPSPYYRNDWKIDPWKCPYHNGRAMMELISRIDRITNNTNHKS